MGSYQSRYPYAYCRAIANPEQCEVIHRFGKKHLEDVEPEINTLEAVAPWCSIDTSSGNLTVVLEPFNCFDAEMYADDLILAEPIEFREDQRSMWHERLYHEMDTNYDVVNLGRWILRYLFARLIDEEIKRDEAHRQKLNEIVEKRKAALRSKPPTSILIPSSNAQGWELSDSPVTTPRANGANWPLTPGLGIGVATPTINMVGVSESAFAPGSPLDKAPPQPLNRASVEDYFTSGISSADAPTKVPTTPGPAPADQTAAKEETPKSPVETKDKEKDTAKSPTTPFGKKFRMGMSFGTKKLGRSASTNIEKPTVPEEKPEENKSESSSNHEKEIDDNFHGVIQKIHIDYEKKLLETPDNLIETQITPALPIDAPVLKLPSGTRVIIQEETSGGSANLYRGNVMSVGADADIIEEKAPMWLGEVLLTVCATPPGSIDASLTDLDRTPFRRKNQSRSRSYYILGRTRYLASQPRTETTALMRIGC